MGEAAVICMEQARQAFVCEASVFAREIRLPFAALGKKQSVTCVEEKLACGHWLGEVAAVGRVLGASAGVLCRLQGTALTNHRLACGSCVPDQIAGAGRYYNQV